MLYLYQVSTINRNGASILDLTGLTTTLSVSAFTDVIQSALPLVGVAVLVGFLFYVIRWSIGLFRGV